MDARRVLDDVEPDLEEVALGAGQESTRWPFSMALAVFLVLLFLMLRMSGGGAGPDIAAFLRSDDALGERSAADGPPADDAPVPKLLAATAHPATSEVPAQKSGPSRSGPLGSLWPFAGRGLRFDQPADVAVSFAETYVGFSRPIVGPFHPIDEDYGEVEIRAAAGGPVTLVLVQRLAADQTWWVVGASATHINLDNPAAHSTIGDPLYVSGEAVSVDGQVQTELRASGGLDPIVQIDFVISDGLQSDWFEGVVGWTRPGPKTGALMVVIRDPERHEVLEATVVSVNLP